MLQLSIGVSVLHTNTVGPPGLAPTIDIFSISMAPTLLLSAAYMIHYTTCKTGGLPCSSLCKMSASYTQAKREP